MLCVADQPGRPPKGRHRSYQEVCIEAELKAVGVDVHEECRNIWLVNSQQRWEVDIIDPDRRIVIEFDGISYHSSPESYDRDVRKTEQLSDAGLTVIRIREGSCTPVASNDVRVAIGDKPKQIARAVAKMFVKRGLYQSEELDMDLV